MLATVPRLRGKLQCALFRRQADGLCGDAEAGLRTVQAACRQVCAAQDVMLVYGCTTVGLHHDTTAAIAAESACRQ